MIFLWLGFSWVHPALLCCNHINYWELWYWNLVLLSFCRFVLNCFSAVLNLWPLNHPWSSYPFFEKFLVSLSVSKVILCNPLSISFWKLNCIFKFNCIFLKSVLSQMNRFFLRARKTLIIVFLELTMWLVNYKT